jgi:hypothetical protein
MQNLLDPRNGSGKTMHWMVWPSSDGQTFQCDRKARTHGLPVGKPPSHPVGWLPQPETVVVKPSALRFFARRKSKLSGPRRAQAREQIAEKSARYPQPAHEANSRFAAWAGCIFLVNTSLADAQEIFLKSERAVERAVVAGLLPSVADRPGQIARGIGEADFAILQMHQRRIPN